MRIGKSGMGMSKHRKSGKAANYKHFTGKKRGKRINRGGLTRRQRKQRRKKRGTHKNKYKTKKGG